MRILKKEREARYRYALILLREFAKTDFKIRYQGSLLGYFWALLRPLFLFLILYTIFVHFLRIGRGIENWPIAMLLGIVMWNFYSEITKRGLKAIVGNIGIIRKINFPKYVIILSTGASAFINLGVNLTIVFVFMIIAGISFSWSILLLPLFILELFIFSVGVALILSTIYVRFRDINFVWEIIMQGMFYASAIIFPINLILAQNTVAGQVLMLNPVLQSLQDMRSVTMGGDMPTLYQVSGNLWISLVPYATVAATFIYGVYIFKKNAKSFAEKA